MKVRKRDMCHDAHAHKLALHVAVGNSKGKKIGPSLAGASMKATGAEQLAGSRWMGASMMWIVVVYGLFPVDQVYSKS